MKHKPTLTGRLLSLSAALLLSLLCIIVAAAATGKTGPRLVKVAFFPMEGYHTIYSNGAYGGLEVEYLQTVCEFVNWRVEYVPCNSWEEALSMLETQQVDLVGTAQYSAERAEKFCYADMPSGYTFGAIATSGQSDIAYEDFLKMRNIRYGIVTGYVRTAEFYQYLADHGIDSPTVYEYPNTAALQNALTAGQIDAIVHTFMEMQPGQRLIGRFASKPVYFMTHKENESLANELNSALVDIKYHYPELETDLMHQFFDSKWDNSLLYTTEEFQYLQDHPELVVGYQDGHYPFIYKENGELKGLLVQAFEKQPMTISYVELGSQGDAVRALKEGRIDVFAHLYSIPALESDDQLQYLSTYSTIPLVLITEKNLSMENVDAIATLYGLDDDLRNLLDTQGKTILCTETLEECFDLVLRGQADVLMGSGYLAERLISTKAKYNNLTISTVLNDEIDIHMLVRADADETLKSVLVKAVGHISEKSINEYALKENARFDLDLITFLRSNSIFIILGLVFLSVLTMVVAHHIVRKEKRIKTLLYRDPTMDLWNQHYFTKEADARRNSGDKYAIVYTHILRMRQFSLVYGRRSARKVFFCIRNVLKSSVDETADELCAYISAEHFLVLMKYTDTDSLQERLDSICRRVENSIYSLTGNRLHLYLGVYPDISNDGEAHDIQTMIECATQVLDEAGNLPDKHIFLYDSDFEHRTKQQLQQETMLEAINGSELFRVFYQNKVDIRTEEIVGAEALVRLIDPEDPGKIKSPWFFIPYYEKTGRIVQIDFFVLDHVCQMLRRRLDAGQRVVPISCNFSRLNFIVPDFYQRFEEVLDRHGISKELIEVEITETALVEPEHQHVIRANLSQMKQRGIRLSIDDFGAGYSSLGLFEQVPANVIKLDRSFMLNCEDGERRNTIMRSIVELSQGLNADLVCEGVETQEDVDLMKSIHAHIAQGYFYSMPAPEDEFEAML